MNKIFLLNTLIFQIRTSWLLSVLCWLGLGTVAQAQIAVTVTNPTNTTPALATSYTSFASALTAVNAVTAMTGSVTLTLAAGESETASTATGFVLGSATLNPVLSATNTITIVKASGAATVLNAAVGVSNGPTATPDGILSVRGADFVTIDGLTFTDGNTASATVAMEFGIGFFKAGAGDGCNNNTVQNCIFNMQRVNNTSGTAPMVEGSVAILVVNSTAIAATTVLTPTNGGTLATNGTNSNNKFYTNTINGGNYGIVLSGFAASAGVGPAPTATTFLGDLGNDIGGNSALTGNTILNFGGAASATNPSAGIRVNNAWSTNISFNTIDNNNGSGVNHVTTLRGIFAQAGTSATATINNNTVTVRSGATTSSLIAIDNGIGSTAATNTININNNTIRFSYTTATTGVFNAISNSSTAASLNINANNIQQLASTNYPSTGDVRPIVGGSPGGTLSINNNTISNFNMTGASGNLRAITATTPVGLYTCTGNTIENLSYATVGSTGSITGIYNLSSATLQNWNNNIIRNFSTPGTGTLNGIQNNTVSGTFQCRNNQIYNFTTSAGGAGGFTANGITWSNANVDISGNIIYAINSTGTTGGTSGTIYGITHSGAATVTRNAIYDLSSNSTNVTVAGINVNATGTNTISNNLIGDLRSPNSTGNISIAGIIVASGTTNNIFHNTVNIAATTTSASTFGTSAIYFSSSLPVNNVRNNIFVNTSASGPTGGFAAAIRYTIAPTSTNFPATNNNNLYFAGTPSATKLIYGETGTATATNPQQTIANYKTYIATTLPVAGRESASVSENPSFVSTSGTNPITSFLKYDTSIALQLEQGGILGTGITTDYAGTTRCPGGGCPGSAPTPDMGAWELVGIPSDLTPPTISYTALGNICASTPSRVLVATITDANGVPTSGVGLPVLYWRLNTGSYTGVQGVSLGGNQYQFTFGATTVTNDIISYYIVAQDNAGTPNVGSFPSAGASGFSINAPAVTTPPTTPSSYTQTPSLAGTYNVGVGQTYITLTAAVNAYNTNCLTGAVTFVLTDATYSTSETFPIVINANSQASSTNTLTIKPATASTISGSVASGALIRLNGADFVTIDGSNSGGTDRSLTITNTNTTAPTAISIVSLGAGAGSVNSIVRNCNISTGVATSTGYGIAVGGATPGTSGADNDNVTIQNNVITVATVGIYANGTASVSAGGLDNLTVSGNNVTTNTTLATLGIQLGNALNSMVMTNIVSVETSTTSQPTGISLETGFVSSTVTRNTITKALATNAGGYGGRGITIGTGTATSNLTVANNVIYGVNGSNWNSFGNSSSMGIAVGIVGTSTTLTTTTGGVNLYYNSVNMAGSMGSGSITAITTALYVGSGASALDIRNNIFVNTQVATNTTQKNYAIFSAVANTAFSNINNNDYFVSNTGNAASAVLGFLGSDRTNLAGIITGFGQNTNSINVNPLFTSSTNLIPLSVPADNRGVFIAGITTDITNATRSGSTPDLGAYEFTGIDLVPPVITYTPLSSVCVSTPSRVLVATITDDLVMPTSGVGLPMLYWRLNGGAYTGVQGVYLGGNQYQFTFGPATTTNDVVSYYVVAQDAYSLVAPNVAVFPSAGASGFTNTPPAVSTPPTTPSFYTHGAGLAGTYTVGATGNFATLTAAIFSFNAGCATAPVIFELIDTAYPSETFPIAINQIANASINTLTIRPSTSVGAVTITGSNATSLIDLNGADYVTINGTNGASTLTISNTSTATTANTIRLFGDATNNTITNTTLLGSGSLLGGAVINVGSVVATGNNNNTFSNNKISLAGTNFPTTGILSFSGSTTISNSQNSITNNQFIDIFNPTSESTAININGGNTAWSITNNKIFQTDVRTATAATTSLGISITSGAGYTINNNVIGFANDSGTGTTTYTSTFSHSFTPIAVGGLVAGAATNIQGNTISNINITTASTATMFNGIFLAGAGDVNIGTTTPNIIGSATSNDAISITASASGGTFFGIRNTSTGVINISNNIIGSMTAVGSTATVALSIHAINTNAGTNNIIGNSIGSTTVPNSINSSTDATGSTQNVSGIVVTTTTLPTTISNNTIANLNQASTSTSAFVRGIAYSASSVGIISGNSINNLFGANANTALTGITSVTGIAATGFPTNMTITQNTIFALANTNAGAVATHVVGIGYANATNATISKNKIYDLRNASTMTTITTPPTATGILLRGTAATVVNNMISLGDLESTNTAFIGISNNVGSGTNALNIYHNTVYIAGTVTSGALPSFAFSRGDFSTVAITSLVNVRNNIFYNTRSGGTGLHYAIANNFGATASATGWGVNASNYNTLYAVNATNVGYWTTALSFATWKTSSSSDANSLETAITFADTPNGDLHIVAPYPNPFDGLGINIPTVTDDFDGQTRANTTPVDIGADAGAFFDYPIITYTPLGDNCSTGATTLVANIANGNGVPVSGIGLPRLYWRIGTGAYQTSVATSLGGGNYQFSLGTGSVVNDVISYYIVAQDFLGNIGSSPSAGASGFTLNPPSASTPPTTPSSYTNLPILSGNYNIGVGQTYTTLTAAVNAYNTSCLDGAVTFVLKDANYSAGETFPIVINANPQASATNTLTIRPDVGINTTISGSSATSIINLNGADFVTIDGSNVVGGTTKNLTITNTNTATTSAVVWASSNGTDGATNINVRNSIIVGQAPTTTLAGIGAGSATIGTTSLGTNNHNLNFSNNDIRAVQFGIYSSGFSASTKNQGFVANNNVINSPALNRVGLTGIFVTFTNNITISNNIISEITNTADNIAINIGFSATGGFSTTSTGSADGVSNVTITNNNIGNVVNTGTFSAIGIGLGNTISGTSLIANNVIYGVAANSTGGDIGAGILLGGGTASINVFYNTVHMQGTITGATAATQNSTAFGVTSSAAPTALTVRNNIFVNTQLGNTGATIRFSAIALTYNTPFNGTFNNNALHVTGAGPGTYNIAWSNGFGGTNHTTFADWRTATGYDANSVNANPSFVSGTDLTPTACALDNKAVSITGITTDFAGATRSATPDIGAYEFASVLTITPTTLSNATLNVPYTQALTQTGIPGTLTWTVSAGALPTGMALSTSGSLSGTPLMAGTFNFTAQVTDGVCTNTRVYTLVVDCPVTTISPATLTNGTLGVAYTQTLTTDLIGTITWSVSAGSLPTGLSLDANTGVLSGTPTIAGLFNFTVEASSSTGCSATPRAYSFAVDCPTMTITTASLPNGVLSTVYTSTTLAQTGLPAPAWSVSAGSLPTGLSLNTSTGEISGTPTALGTFNFTIKAEQSTCNITKAFSVSIACPTLAMLPSGGILPDAIVNSPYSQTLSVTGLSGTYTWAVTTGTMPTGLTLNPTTGEVSGTPTALGINSLTFTATHTSGCSISVLYGLDVVNLPSFTTQPTNAAVCPNATATFTVVVSSFDPATVQWEEKIGTGSFTPLTNIAPYSGVTTSTLTINGATLAMNGRQYRCIATNPSGTAISDVVTLTTTDLVKPTLTVPSNITFNASSGNVSNCGQVVTFTAPTATDNCTASGSIVIAQTAGLASGATFPLGTTTITFTATDEQNNVDTKSFTVTVVDNVLPTVITQNITRNLGAGNTVSITASEIDNGSTDNCPGALVYSVTPSTFNCSNLGANTVTLTVTDANGNIKTETATVTINEIVAPTLTIPANITVNADAGLCTAIVNYTVSATDNCTPSSSIVLNRTAGLASGAAFPKGVTTVTYTATDASGNVSTGQSFTITVNDTQNPTIVGCPANIVVNNTAGLNSAVVNYTAPTPADNCSGSTIALTSPANTASGSTFPLGVTTVTYTATDASGNTAVCSFTVTVNFVNAAPTFTASTPAAVLEDAGAQSIANWATGNDNDEAVQALSYEIGTIGTPTLFSVAPAVSATGTLTYTAAPNANGTSTFQVRIKDDGGVANGGVDVSAYQTFTITVTAVNDAPSFTASNPPASNEDAGVQTVTGWVTTSSAGPSDESTQTLSYEIGTISNTALFSVVPAVASNGTLTYTAAPNANGTSTFQVRIKDNGGVANGGVDVSAYQTFTITVNNVNDAPIFTALANIPASLEDGGVQSVPNFITTSSAGPANESTQSLSYEIGTIGTPTLFSVAPAVASNGTLTYTAAANANGTSTFQVRIKDDGGVANGGVDMSVYQTFTITVTAVNDAPSFTTSNPPSVLEDALAQTVTGVFVSPSAGPANESSQTFTYFRGNILTGASLFSVAPAINVTTGELTYTPAPNAFGTSTVEVYVKDNGGVANGGDDEADVQIITITINGVNDAPSFTALATIPASNEDAGVQTVPNFVTASSAGENESAQTISYEVEVLSNPALFSVAPAVSATGTLTYTAAPNANGTSNFRVRIKDNGGTANSGVDVSAYQTFTITVNAVNDAPTLGVIGDRQQLAGTSFTVNLTGIAPGGGTDETSQTLSVTSITTITGSNVVELPTPTSINITNGMASFVVKFTANIGTANIRVVVKDNGGTANIGVDSVARVFTVTSKNQQEVFIAETFTPNGDGKNDFFRVQASKGLVKTITLTVINPITNGVVFESNLIDRVVDEGSVGTDLKLGWDGKDKNGVEQPQGTYVWKISGTFSDGRPITATSSEDKKGKTTGTINLVRGTN